MLLFCQVFQFSQEFENCNRFGLSLNLGLIQFPKSMSRQGFRRGGLINAFSKIIAWTPLIGLLIGDIYY